MTEGQDPVGGEAEDPARRTAHFCAITGINPDETLEEAASRLLRSLRQEVPSARFTHVELRESPRGHRSCCCTAEAVYEELHR